MYCSNYIIINEQASNTREIDIKYGKNILLKKKFKLESKTTTTKKEKRR